MCCTCNLFFGKLDLLILMPFSLPSPFSITRFNFFIYILTRASLLALAKSIYYIYHIRDVIFGGMLLSGLLKRVKFYRFFRRIATLGGWLLSELYGIFIFLYRITINYILKSKVSTR